MFIAKNNDLIILANNSREELEQALQFTVYTSIEETEENYILINGSYVTEAQALISVQEQKQQENIDKCKEKRYSQEFMLELQEQECLFDTTEQTQADLMAAGLVTSTGATYDNWVCNNGAVINLTAQDVQTIFARFFMLVSPLYTVEKQYSEQIEACTTIEEVEAIDLNYEIN